MKSVEDSNGFFMYPWRFLREVLGDLYVRYSLFIICWMIIYQLLHDLPTAVA